MTKDANPRSLLVEFLGAFVRGIGGWIPIAALVSLMNDVGVDEPTTRMLVSRLKQRGWLLAERRQRLYGYRLGDPALEAFRDGDQIIWHARERADLADGWVLIAASVPEKKRARRHVLRSRLGALGFGNIGPGTWLAPARMLDQARLVLDEFELAPYCDVFLAHYDDEQSVADLVSRGWDLESLADDYREFIADQLPLLQSWRLSPHTDDIAFRQYLLALHAWRDLPFRDPGLPRVLMGNDWPGEAALEVFEEIVAALGTAAARHVSDTCNLGRPMAESPVHVISGAQ